MSDTDHRTNDERRRDIKATRAVLQPLRDYTRHKGNLAAICLDGESREFLTAMVNDLNRIMDRIERES